MRRTVAALALSALLAAPARTADAPRPVVDALFPAGRVTRTLADLGETPLAPGEGFRIEEIGRDANTSHHLVWIRDREVPHRHDRHDLFVVIVRGFGTMRIGAEERPVGEGSILYVPRGTPHAFRNGSGAPALAYAVYAPAFDGTDRAPAD